MATTVAVVSQPEADAAAANPERGSILLAVGNPLLDIVANVDNEFIDGYGLTHGDSCLQTPRQHGIYERLIKEHSPSYLPGGSALNTARMFQALSDTRRVSRNSVGVRAYVNTQAAVSQTMHADNKTRVFLVMPSFAATFVSLAGLENRTTAAGADVDVLQPKSVMYVGAVGDDEGGELLEKLATNEGLDMRLQKISDAPTGKCAVLVHNKERTLCTYLGASAKLVYTDAMGFSTKRAEICYMPTYVLQSSKEVVFRLAKQCEEGSTLVALNLSSRFAVSARKDALKELLPTLNIVFGNAGEYAQLVTDLGLVEPYDEASSDRAEYDRRVCQLVLGLMTARKTDAGAEKTNAATALPTALKAAVMTRQAHPVYVAEARYRLRYSGAIHMGGPTKAPVTHALSVKIMFCVLVLCSTAGELLFQEIPVPHVPENEIVDVNGAGDAFVGGFFAAFTRGYSLSKATLLGCLAAGHTIRRQGFCRNLNGVGSIFRDAGFLEKSITADC